MIGDGCRARAVPGPLKDVVTPPAGRQHTETWKSQQSRPQAIHVPHTPTKGVCIGATCDSHKGVGVAGGGQASQAALSRWRAGRKGARGQGVGRRPPGRTCSHIPTGTLHPCWRGAEEECGMRTSCPANIVGRTDDAELGWSPQIRTHHLVMSNALSPWLHRGA